MPTAVKVKKARRSSGASAKPRVQPPIDVIAHFAEGEDAAPVDVEAHARWLETGEGEPWPRVRPR